MQFGHPERVQPEDDSELDGDAPSKVDVSHINFLEVSFTKTDSQGMLGVRRQWVS